MAILSGTRAFLLLVGFIGSGPLSTVSAAQEPRRALLTTWSGPREADGERSED